MTTEAQQRYQAEWYRRPENRRKTIDKAIVNNRKYRQERRDWIRSLGFKCRLCGEDRYVCLDFHHSDPTIKEFNVSRALTGGISKERILQEIAKCDIVCANHHRLIHALLV